MIVKDHKSLQQSVIERLYGRYKNTPLVDDLEAEHAAEIGLRQAQPDRLVSAHPELVEGFLLRNFTS